MSSFAEHKLSMKQLIYKPSVVHLHLSSNRRQGQCNPAAYSDVNHLDFHALIDAFTLKASTIS